MQGWFAMNSLSFGRIRTKTLEDAVPKGMRLYLPVERREGKRGRHIRGRKGRKEARYEGEGRKEEQTVALPVPT